MFNPIQAGVFWNHIGWGGTFRFLLYLWSNYNQTWHDGTLGQNLSKPIKIFADVITRSQVWRHRAIVGTVPDQNSSSLIFCPMELKFGTGVNSEALISNSGQKIRYKYVLKEKRPSFTKKLKFLPKCSLTKVLPWQHPGLLLTENYFIWCPI